MINLKPFIKKKNGDKEERSAFLALAEKLYAPSYLREEGSNRITEVGLLGISGRASEPLKPQPDKGK